ncbi:ABC transporter substrate-binding protein [Halostella salina]|uniref:ABC transporter substrate-binding protein n=1 Tax=Halostella salina TaxID=1547897 RepID=UPI000EF7FB25|nr:ABC transporter substrate-binding protein [Halostella salina]
MDPTLSRRRLLQATAGTATAAAVAGRSIAERRSAIPPGTDVLQLVAGRAESFDPVVASDETSMEVITQVFDTLTHFPDGETRAEPLLASDIRTEDDGRYVEIDLKRGVRFHDGSELTADDVVYSFERIVQSDQSRYQLFLLDDMGIEHRSGDGEYAPGSLAVTAESEYTVSIRLETPFHSVEEMLAMPWCSIMPEGIVGDVEGYSGELQQPAFAQNPVGTGPFEFVGWEPGNGIEVRRWEEYHGTVPSVEAVNWRLIQAPMDRYGYTVVDENAHEVTVPPERFDAGKRSIDRTDDRGRRIGTYGPLENEKTVDYFSVPDLITYYVGFNQENTNRAVREAFAHVLNQSTVVEELFNEPARPAAHLTPPNLFPNNAAGYREHAEQYPYGIDETNIQRARQIMEQAGYSESDPYELEFAVYTGAFWADLGGILSDQLQSANVDLTVQRMDFGTLTERGRNGDLEAYSLGWGGNYPGAPDFLQLLAPERADAQSAPLSYVDWAGTNAAEEAAAAWEYIQQRPDPDPGAYVAMEQANWEDIVLLPVLHPVIETMWYDTLDVPMHGSVGRQKYNTVTDPGNGGGGGGGGGDEDTGGGGGGGAGGGSGPTVRFTDDFTIPDRLYVEPGTTVTFEWAEGGAHNIVVDSQPDGANWSGVEPIEDPGFVHEHTFEVPGEYEYHCAPHEGVGEVGSIVVAENLGDDPRVVEHTGDNTFDPEELTVEVGTTVRFRWADGSHNLAVESQPEGATWQGHESVEDEGHVHEHTFRVVGEYEYHCQPHESLGQEGVVTVVAPGNAGGGGGGNGGSGGGGGNGGDESGTDDVTADAAGNESANGSAEFAGDSQAMPGFGVGSALTALAAGGAIRWLTDDDEAE